MADKAAMLIKRGQIALRNNNIEEALSDFEVSLNFSRNQHLATDKCSDYAV